MNLDYSFTERDMVPKYPFRDIPTKYERVVGKSGSLWLVPDTGNADSIYCSNSDKTGFGGSTLDFALLDGSKFSVKGPWHSNSDALFSETGIDLRKKCWTFGCVSFKKESGYTKYGISGKMTSIMHLDKEWTCGSFSRIHDIAEALA